MRLLLLVEDEVATHDTLTEAKDGCEIVTATDGQISTGNRHRGRNR
jgi:hypothetical protein